MELIEMISVHCELPKCPATSLHVALNLKVWLIGMHKSDVC